MDCENRDDTDEGNYDGERKCKHCASIRHHLGPVFLYHRNMSSLTSSYDA